MAISDKIVNTQVLHTLRGTNPRIMEVSATGEITAPYETTIGKLGEATAISRLIVESNWDYLGVYVGTAITGTYEGQYYQSGIYFYQCYTDNVWIRTVIASSKYVVSLTDSNESEGAGSYVDIVTGKSGRGRIVFGDAVGYADFVFTTAGAVTLIAGGTSSNVSASLQTGTNHVIIKDNGTNVRIVNELGATTVFSVEISYTN